MKRIAIQGQPGSFHHGVAVKFFESEIDIVCRETFASTFKALASDEADAIVTAVENSLYGTLHEVIDLVLRYDFPIIGEYTEHINQQLVGFAGTKLTDITEVYSHPAALDQCRDWLQSNLPDAEIIEHHDTAGAVQFVKESGNHHYAAIAGDTAAALYEMSVLAADIEDEKENFTRFFVLAKSAGDPATTNKASLLLTTTHESGALYRALGVFNEQHLNLTKLESRPIRGEAFHYQFFVDVECDSRQLERTTEQLDALGCDVRVLGQYHSSTMPQA